MPSISALPDRHTVIDARQGHYLCFPDVVQLGDGRLLVAYNEFEKHVGSPRRQLLLKYSADHGRTWTRLRRLKGGQSHCPRITRLTDGELVILDDAGPFMHRSRDNGATWQTTRHPVLRHGLLDKALELEDGVLLTTGHMHRGTFPHPAVRQPTTEQMVYRSQDNGTSWQRLSVLAFQRNLVLCEASMIRLPDGRLLALMRENSFVYEPMYASLSTDLGCTWSDPVPTPLIGHRPTLGMSGDDLLVTYRNLGPDQGTAAWLGSLDELLSDFRVHGRHVDPGNPTLTRDGLRVVNDAGDDAVVRYALRPLTDPRSATATLEAVVRVDRAGPNGCGLRLGTWWRITPEGVTPEVNPADTPDGRKGEQAETVPLRPGCFHTLRLDYARGRVTLSVNGEPRSAVAVDPDHADTRPILLGAPYPFEDNAVDCTWKRARLVIDEPAMLRKYSWEWDHRDGLPDQWALDRVLELRNDRRAAPPDFGYSGWAELEDGSFFCASHHGGGARRNYTPMHTAQVVGTRFSREDFG